MSFFGQSQRETTLSVEPTQRRFVLANMAAMRTPSADHDPGAIDDPVEILLIS